MKTYLINLEDSRDRLAASTLVLQGLDLPFERVAAFDGRGKAVVDLPEYDPPGAVKAIGREMSGGEVGCYVSHVWAAREFLSSDATMALVVEDDVEAGPHAQETLAELTAWLASNPELDWDLVNLGETTKRYFVTEAQLPHANVLRRSFYLPMTTTALLWSRRGAERFLQVALPARMPIDHFLRQWAAETGRGFSMKAAIFPARGVASIIDQQAPRRRARRGLRAWVTKHRTLFLTKRMARRTMLAWQGRK